MKGQDRMDDSDGNSFLGRGWAFPPTFDRATSKLRLSSGVDNIQQSIDLLIRTPRGARALRPDFGCDLLSYLFKHIDATAQEEIVQSVKTMLLNDEPRIEVESIELDLSDNGALAQLNIIYVVCQTNTRHNHVFPFSVLEGTNLQLGI
jgi:uncharacterized protein